MAPNMSEKNRLLIDSIKRHIILTPKDKPRESRSLPFLFPKGT